MTVKNDSSVGATIARVTGDAGGARVPSLARRLLGRPSTGMVAILFVLVAVFSLMRPEAFLGAYNFRSIALAASVVGVMAIGQTFVLATGGIDLSVGSVLVALRDLRGLRIRLAACLHACVLGGARS
ncbi:MULTISPECIES: hypothetical protein [Amycolatopsis]|uniref:ABC transporter permease n=1 Tax=Amycolatopsis albidoflavus TaxID=102226 RepID=A0ABW5I3K1_9PSEU